MRDQAGGPSLSPLRACMKCDDLLAGDAFPLSAGSGAASSVHSSPAADGHDMPASMSPPGSQLL